MPGSSQRPLPEQDLAHVLEHTRDFWEDLRGGRLFVTGGTGFFGRWMLETFLRANQDLGLGADVIVLTRDPQAFAAAAPHVALHPQVSLHPGDVRSFEFPSAMCSHVLHLATETALRASPAASFATAVEGTARVLAFAEAATARKVLITSSGAVYGPQPPELERISEDYAGAPRSEDASAGYAHGKRAAEFLGSVAAAEGRLEVKIARCFAFVGPMLPLDANFAIGNFIRDALIGDAIRVTGDGTARRSYLYAADLAVWLWTILIKGESGRPYNVGSEDDVSIGELAGIVGAVVRPGLEGVISQNALSGVQPQRYVPSTARALDELGLRLHFDLRDAISRTADWYSSGPSRRAGE